MSGQGNCAHVNDARASPTTCEVSVSFSNVIRDLTHPTKLLQEECSVQKLFTGLSVTSRNLQNCQVNSFSSKQVNLSNLPNDLILYIFSKCDARTVGKLRQCCKEFYQHSHQLIVWLEVLRETCMDLNLPIPSFQRNEEPSLSIELLATAWIRFSLALRKATDGKPPSPHRMVRGTEIPGQVLGLQQSPDGQFLFIIHTSGIRVFNLQYPLPISIGSFAMEIPAGSGLGLSVEYESNNSFILHLSVNARLPRLSLWLAFRLSFSQHVDEATHFNLLSRLDRLLFSPKGWGGGSSHPTLPVLVTTFQHITDKRYYLLWNFVQSTCAIWEADARDEIFESSISLLRGFIIASHRASGALVVYTLPDIPPKDSYAPEISVKLSNPALLYIPTIPNSVNRQSVTSLFWQTSSNGGHVASDHDGDVSLCETGDRIWVLEQSELHRTDRPSSMFAPLPLALKRSCLLQIIDPPSFPIAEGMNVDAYTYPDQSLLLDAPSQDWTKIVFHLSAPTDNGNGDELGKGILYDSHKEFNLTHAIYSLCPFTGRLCITTPSGVEIVDFVELSYQQNNTTF
ncbi:hypothetical protein DL96DRAFT_1609359 [Flagelloscypha sp. PMI_526]|nr:hypothetical protein DL96DRAFT_1609359 [Flagelloscypha sp. PMI_526]